MGKWLRRALLALCLVVPLGLVGFFVAMRQLAPTPAQQLALARLRAPTPPVRGHDASDAIWLLGYDVPDDERAAVAAQLRRYVLARAHGQSGQADPRRAYRKFPEQPKGGAGVCQDRAPGCLAYVSANRAEVAAVLDAHRSGLEAAGALAMYDGFRLGVRPALDMEWPQLGTGQRLVITELAQRFAAGERLSAVESTCRDLAAWRRIGGDSDFLVVSMVGVGRVGEDLMLLSDMLAILPKETELPAPCVDALAASSDAELDLCPAMRAEFKLLPEYRAEYERDDRGAPSWLVDWNHVEAMRAVTYGAFCDPALRAKMRADALADAVLPPPPRCEAWRRRGDPIGCELVESHSATWDTWGKYLDRRVDQAQMLALMRTVVWLRVAAEDPAEVPALLASRAPELGLLRAPRYDAGHDVLSISLHDPRYGARFELDAGVRPRATHSRHTGWVRRSRALVFND